MFKLPKILETLVKKDNIKNVDEKYIEILSPMYGEIIDISQIPDTVFASKIIGDGVGIIPAQDSDTLYSPCSTHYMSIFETGHAISFDLDGLELIIHIGVGTVNLKGQGFTKIKPDGSIEVNDIILKYDLDFIKNNSKSEKTAIIIANMKKVLRIEKMKGIVKPGDLLMKVYYY